MPPLPCRSFRLRPKAGAGCQSRSRARRRKPFPLRLLHSMQPAPQGKPNGGHGGLCRLLHPKLRGKHALRRRTGWPACCGQDSFPPPARRTRAGGFTKPRPPPARVCLPAASGHSVSQNRARLRLGPACPPQAGILLRKTALASGWGLLARCKREFCFTKPRPPPAGVCLPAARGHSASQNRARLRLGPACPLQAGILLRKTAPASGWGLLARCKRAFCFAKPQNPLFSKNNAAVYVESPSGGNAALHGFG